MTNKSRFYLGSKLEWGWCNNITAVGQKPELLWLLWMVRAESKHLSVHKQQQHISAVSLASKSHSVCGSRDEEHTQHPGASSLHTDRPGSIGLTGNLQWCEVEPARLGCHQHGSVWGWGGWLESLMCEVSTGGRIIHDHRSVLLTSAYLLWSRDWAVI